MVIQIILGKAGFLLGPVLFHGRTSFPGHMRAGAWLWVSVSIYTSTFSSSMHVWDGSMLLPGCRTRAAAQGCGLRFALAPVQQPRLRSCQTRPQAARCGVDWGHGALPGIHSVPLQGALLVYD